jgi:hypothetical protein
VAAAAAIVLCALAAGARPGGGWHSPDTRYRVQTEAFFRGTFALQPVPHGQRADWAWGNGSQQVWGLGVPFLRMPGEVLARAAGQRSFPDRVTLIAVLAIVIAILVRATDGQPSLQRASLIAVVGLLPAFVTLLRTRMFVYEEAVAYAYLWAALQLALVIGVIAHTSHRWIYAAAVVAGFGAWIRPTVFLYGLATMAVIAALTWRQWRVLAAAAALFAAMTLLVLWTNHARFGDPLEFGQRVNSSRWVLDQYAKNFDYPYAHEPLLSAGRELLAATTAAVRFNDNAFYAPGPSMHPWFSSTVRFREFYFTTWLGPFLLMAIAGWVLALRAGPRHAAFHIAAWSFLAFVLLTAFYIRMPTTTSRYVVDLAAAIGGGVVALIWLLFADDRRTQYRGPAIVVIVALIAAGNVRAAISPTHAAQSLVRSAEAIRMTPPPVTSGAAVPSSYRCGDRIDAVGIPFNGVGWNWSGDCGVDVGTTLFMTVPGDRVCVSIELDGPLPSDAAGIQVKLGSTFLERRADPGLVFCAPPSFRRQPSAVEIASFKWVAVENAANRSQLKSLKVESISVSSQE